MNFWFGSQFKAMYLPWVLFGFGLVISGSFIAVALLVEGSKQESVNSQKDSMKTNLIIANKLGFFLAI